MAQAKNKDRERTSRRAFLTAMGWAPVAFLPAPLRSLELSLGFGPSRAVPSLLTNQPWAVAFADARWTPHYPAKSPLDDVLRQMIPGSDGYVSEKYAVEIGRVFEEWGRELKASTPALETLAKFLAGNVEGARLGTARDRVLRKDHGIEIVRRQFPGGQAGGRDGFLAEVKTYFAALQSVDRAEFEITSIQEALAGPRLRIAVRYGLAGARREGGREARNGTWLLEATRREPAGWSCTRWETQEEAVSRARAPLFADITGHCLGKTESYWQQLRYGVDHWRTVLDGACGIDVYGNNGLAAGDMDNDGCDDLYICQPAGLPNRLYRNRGDGTFEDITEQAGVGVLDSTASALFADFENKGRQDLLVVCGNGPLLFVNQGGGRFELKKDAFRFARPPQGTFTHASACDYDGDGLLDVYFCVYSYYLGLDQYHYPAPYFDARNGPPNFLFHNRGDGTFEDRTEACGLNVDNNRYSFASAWGSSQADGRPDLYVANDFGRSNFYVNRGDGTFVSGASEAGVEQPGAGMSACWMDFDNDGRQDIYVANMWSAAGMRVAEQNRFQEGQPEAIRALYRGHAMGNSLYRNRGNGKFENVSGAAGAAVGRWAWCSDSWDFDHDGFADLYVTNGYISGPAGGEFEGLDAASFFWRQVVANSPPDATVSPKYELGWNAINELIRSDASWNGRERNVVYANNRDGTFSDISGISGLDGLEDSRAFAVTDLDGDGRLEVVLKNRNGPQLRVLRNEIEQIGDRVVFRLRGTGSNQDGIGAAITVESGKLRQTKYLQAGTGFLSQHSKEIFFGLGESSETVRATVRWPSGTTQVFESVPVNRRVEITEGSREFAAHNFAARLAVQGEPARTAGASDAEGAGPVRTWLIGPIAAPDFSLADSNGKTWTLGSFRGRPLLLIFWSMDSAKSLEQLRKLQSAEEKASNVRVLALHLDETAGGGARDAVRAVAEKERLSVPMVLATAEIAGIYNIIYRYLFDRRRDLGVPTSFLVDAEGRIVKVYQGIVERKEVEADAASAPGDATQRLRRALPFAGTLYGAPMQRNDFTYGVAMFQRGYLEQAAASFRQVLAAKPEDAEAHYNLGTLYLRRNELAEAREYLQETVKLKPDYPEAWNNLGMIAAQEGKTAEAIANFGRALELRPGYAIAMVNLGNFYRRQGNFAEAGKLLERAVELSPNEAEARYSLGMLYARQEQYPRALEELEKAVRLRPEYPDALNNIGVLLVRQGRNEEAEEKFRSCIGAAPNFDQAYLNLARLYMVSNQKEKAREILKELLRLQPEHKMARQALEMLN